mgnify:CR=1 FL=1
MTLRTFPDTLFSVMGHMKSLHIDWLNAQDSSVLVEGHDGFRVDSREVDFSGVPADALEEMCGWADERLRENQDHQDLVMA